MSLTGPESAATMRRLKPATVDGKQTTPTPTMDDVRLPPVSTPSASSTSTAVTKSGLQRPRRSKSKLKHRKKTPNVEARDSVTVVSDLET